MTNPDPVDRQLALAWQAFTPPSPLRERVRARLGASGQAPLPVARAGAEVVPSRWRSLRASGNVGIAVGVGLFGLGCVAGLFGSTLVTEPMSSPGGASSSSARDVGALTPPSAPTVLEGSSPTPPSLESAPAPATEELAAPAVPVAPVRPSVTLRKAQRGAELVRHAPRPATTVRDWRGELALLERAERAVRADDAALALALLGEFDAQYPRSLLIEERAAVETMAYCQAGATDAAARATRFLQAYPSSVYRARLEAACQSRAPASTEQSPDKKLGAGH